MGEAIAVESASTGYGRRRVLDSVSLLFEEGEFAGIIGPNGSGKTTLLRLISGVLKPWQGSLSLFGRSLSSFSRRDVARMVGVVPQESFFAFDFTAFEIVLMGRSPHMRRFGFETEEDRKIAREAMEQTQTLHMRDRPINRISGGERQRVVIARALTQKPRILVLDEPTSHLDINHQIEVYDILERLNSEGLTVVVISHDLNLAGQYCRRLILMDSGRIVASGTPGDIIVPSLIQEVYKVKPVIEPNPLTGAPLILLLKRGVE